MPSRRSWDIFCTVVDNYGDIGVTWRLARQLAAEHGCAVRLWVDNTETFARLVPGIGPAREVQTLRGIEVHRWGNPFPDVQPAEVVVEAFACHLPENYVAHMAGRAGKPAWINLEYLSAEKWVEGAHALPSPHPRLPLTKYFFFPGFGEKTGGLLREHDLIAGRDNFKHDHNAQAAFWRALDAPPPETGELRISLFSYANAALPTLLEAWADSPHRVTCLAPTGPTLPAIREFFGGPNSRRLTRGSLCVQVLPFVEQETYDRLLWVCDINFVRGEDSFVRAQWAARPFVWHIYPQDDDAHWPKLEAFLDLHTLGAEPATAARIRYLWHAWNRGHEAGAAWRDYLAAREAVASHTGVWAARLAAQPDLASRLVNFCDNLL